MFVRQMLFTCHVDSCATVRYTVFIVDQLPFSNLMNVEDLLEELDHLYRLTPNFLFFSGCCWLFLSCAAGLSRGIKCYGQSVSELC